MRQQNPYLDQALFVGRRQELARAGSLLEEGTSILVIGGRRCGKTSLVRRLSGLRREVVYVDAARWDLASETSVIRSIGATLGASCDSREQFEATLRSKQPTALILDEIDRILTCRWAGSFLSFLRYLDGTSLRTQLALALVGGPELSGYRNPQDGGSPPLNIAEPVYLQPLDRAARRELLALMPAATGPADEILRAGAGHPWLLTRLLAQTWQGLSVPDAIDEVFGHALGNFSVWRHQLGEQGVEFLRALPADGVSKVDFRLNTRWRRFRPAAILARCLCLVDLDETEGRTLPGPAIFTDWLDVASAGARYDLAISYSSENEALARSIFESLENEFKVFFAPAEDDLWGQPLDQVLPEVFGVGSHFVLVLASKRYVERHWPQVELHAAGDKRGSRLLVVDMGGTLDAIPDGIVYRSGEPHALVTLVENLKKKLRSRH